MSENATYGILVVESGYELYQPISEVASTAEAFELARDYKSKADPDNSDFIPPDVFVLWTRGASGRYTRRELLEI